MRFSPIFSLFCALSLIPALNAQKSSATEKSKPPTAAPKAVDKALRARALEFLQDEVDGNFRKAYEFVTNDSKDYYLSLNKEKLGPFQIADIQYSEKFTRALVQVTSTKKIPMMGVGAVEVPSARADEWKLEKGKWMWYHNPSRSEMTTILGPVPTGGPTTGVPTLPFPKDMSAAAVAAAASKIDRRATSIDKDKIQFVEGQPSTEQIVFHNGYPGAVRVVADIPRDYQGFTVEPNITMLNPDGDLAVKITYKPGEDTPKATVFIFTIEPFNTQYRIPVTVVRPPVAPPAAAINTQRPAASDPVAAR